MKVEYLIILKQDDKFCSSVESFKKFISLDDDLSIEGDEIILKVKPNNVFICEIEISTGLIKDIKERYFKVKLTKRTSIDIDSYNSLCRKIKKIAKRINPENVKINTLWDDIGREYSFKAYPLINEVENLMRKLITQFLLINVGMDWHDKALHDDLQEKIKSKTKDNYEMKDELYNTDFIQLSDVLFKKYRDIGLSRLDNIILSAQKKGKLELDQIIGILPISNWERYFSEIIDFDEDKLKDKWKKLYSFRNEVAHNNFLSRASYEQIKALHKELTNLLNETIDNLDKIQLKTTEKDEIRQSYGTKRLIKVAKELNIGTSTIAEYLNSVGFEIDDSPIARVTGPMLEVLYTAFPEYKKVSETIIVKGTIIT